MNTDKFKALSATDQLFWGKQGSDSGFKQAQKAAWFSAFQSQRQEFSYEVTEVEGTLPAALHGSTLFRNGPGRFERGNQRVHHFLDGDGYLCRIAFREDGRVFFDSRFVQTEEFKKEEAADTFLFRSTFGTPKSHDWWANLFELYLKNPANVNALAWGEKLLALHDASLPYRIDPHTLATIGQEGVDGQLIERPLPTSRWDTLQRFARGRSAMTAHPHIDPVRERLVLWNWSVWTSLNRPGTLEIEIVEYDRLWAECSCCTFTMPEAAVNPHDFALTQSYYIFFENRLVFNPWPFVLGQRSPADCLRLLGERPTRVHLVPRPDGPLAGQAPQVFTTSPWFSIHQACAYEQPDGSVVIYSTGWPPSELEGGFLTSWGGYAPNFDVLPAFHLWQTTIHPHQHTVEHRVAPGLENYCIEYPCPNPKLESQAVRYLYMTYSNRLGKSSPPIGYLKLDLQTAEKQLWMEHPLSFTEEPVFVPALNSTREDDGWLIGILSDPQRARSSIVVLDGKDITSGPICRLWLNHHLVRGIHSSWSPEYYGPCV